MIRLRGGNFPVGGRSRIRTRMVRAVDDPALCHLSYSTMGAGRRANTVRRGWERRHESQRTLSKGAHGDATGNRTRVTTVKGWCLSRLTIAPGVPGPYRRARSGLCCSSPWKTGNTPLHGDRIRTCISGRVSSGDLPFGRNHDFGLCNNYNAIPRVSQLTDCTKPASFAILHMVKS